MRPIPTPNKPQLIRVPLQSLRPEQVVYKFADFEKGYAYIPENQLNTQVGLMDEDYVFLKEEMLKDNPDIFYSQLDREPQHFDEEFDSGLFG